MARAFSSEMRQSEERLGQLTGEIVDLPELRAAPFASRYGFRSNTLFEQEEPQWVQLDLGQSHLIDRIVAVESEEFELVGGRWLNCETKSRGTCTTTSAATSAV